MPSLSKTNPRFEARFRVLDGGSGSFHGILSEPSSGEMPSNQFTYARRTLQVGASLPVRAGAVVRSFEGSTFMLADHGESESRGDTLFRTFRLFQPMRLYNWQSREKLIDPTTRLPYDSGMGRVQNLWGCYEPNGEISGGVLNVSFEKARFITNQKVPLDDIVDDKPVTRMDELLGVYVLSLG